MSKIEQFIFLLFGFFIFEILFIRIGFFFNSPITPHTLPFSFFLYVAEVVCFYVTTNKFFKGGVAKYLPVVEFLLVFFLFLGLSFLLGKTYDTSWDGQGYHQSAVIAFADGWNPVKQPSISFAERLPSQIFAEGYPSALWEIEGSVYAFFNKINAAKVMNFILAFIAATLLYSLFRKLRIGKFFSCIISVCIVMQPVYMIQLLTFMEDGFGYELLLIAASSLTIFILQHKAYWAICTFFLAEYFLVTTKYSHLPVALVLGIISALIIFNRFLNKEYMFTASTKFLLGGLLVVGIIFAYLPYGRNLLFHHALFYPTNIPQLMGSVTYNNVPNNLQKGNKLNLLYYGIFSQAQSKESGDPRSKSNIAQIKIPFTFSQKEITDSAQLYNNRVGGGGPLFSGLVVLSILLITFAYFKTESVHERYALYAGAFCFLLILLLSLMAPTPNLMRYVNQVQLLPFVIAVPIYAVFKNKYLRLFCVCIILLAAINVAAFSTAVIGKSLYEESQINKQFELMRLSKKTYQVRVQQFYSSFIILQEQDISFRAVTSLTCHDDSALFASSTTTQYCVQ